MNFCIIALALFKQNDSHRCWIFVLLRAADVWQCLSLLVTTQRHCKQLKVWMLHAQHANVINP